MKAQHLSLFAKLCVVFGAICLATTHAYGQFLRTSYFMDGTHYRLSMNPALSPTRGYVNFPVLGSLNASASSKSFGYKDITDIIDNSSSGDYFMSDDFMGRLKENNQLNFNLSTDILSAGWYKGKNFWSFNVGVRMDMGAAMPKSLFSFMREMKEVNDINDINWSNYNRNIGKESLDINSYAEMGIGYSRMLNDKLTIGGKFKFLLGIGNLKLRVNSIDVNTHLEGVDANTDWENMTPEQISKIKGQADIKVDATLESSFKGLNLTEDPEKGYINDFDFDSGNLGVAGYGGAIDLGAAYKLTDKITLSAAVLDLGFISWSKGSTSTARANTNGLHFSSDNEGDIQRFADIISSGEALNYDMINLQTEGTGRQSRTTWLNSTLVLGGEYAVFDKLLTVGALSTTRFTQPKTLSELTLSANTYPKSWLNATVSYSMIQSAGKSIGLGLKLGPLFVGTDYMFFGNNTKTVNAFLGLSLDRKSVV